MNVTLEQSWKQALANEFEKSYFAQLVSFVHHEYATQQVFPPAKKIFAALDECPLDKVRVVILGQDPYHDDGQAEGLSFSVPTGIAMPPSLRNIYKEIADDIGTPIPTSGSLHHWAAQGVLLLNATLTVRAHQAASHQNKGWETFTDAVVRTVVQHNKHVVFLLWGSYAQRKGSIIDRSCHLVLSSPHPSPLSAHRGFFGNHHFSQANAYLTAHGKEAIAW